VRGEHWWGGRFAEVGEDRADRGGFGEEGDQAHLAVAARAGERPELVDPCEQPGPWIKARRRVGAGSTGSGASAVTGAVSNTGCPAQAVTRARKRVCGANTPA